MNLKLIKLSEEYKRHLFDMMDEWLSTDEKIVPYAIIKNDYKNFNYYMNNLDIKEPYDFIVPDSTYFCIDTERDIFVGAVNIRHYINERLMNGGHIGDGIRPSERNKGYGTEMIRLGLIECKKLGIEKVLMVCNKENIASARTIVKNGGVLENEIDNNGEILQRYWINSDEIKG